MFSTSPRFSSPAGGVYEFSFLPNDGICSQVESEMQPLLAGECELSPQYRALLEKVREKFSEKIIESGTKLLENVEDTKPSMLEL